MLQSSLVISHRIIHIYSSVIIDRIPFASSITLHTIKLLTGISVFVSNRNMLLIEGPDSSGTKANQRAVV